MSRSIYLSTLILLVFFHFHVVVFSVQEEGSEEVPPVGDVAADPIPMPDFSAMKIRDLKAFIARKGTECVACSSKTDLIERAEEVNGWPDKPDKPDKAPTKEELDQVMKNLGNDKERMDKLREELAKAGLDMSQFGGGKDGGPKIFSADDLAQFVKKNPPPATEGSEGAEAKEGSEEEKSSEEKAEL